VLQKRFLSVDYGKKRIGVAVSDPLNIIARGIGTLFNDSSFFDKFAALLAEFDPQAIILGMPYMPSGDIGERATEVQGFAAVLEEKYKLPVILWDERYTSKMAVEIMVRSGMKKKNRAKRGNIDRISSAIILQEYLDSKSAEGESIK
jgi:putative holliday junction resolvase